MDEGTVNLIEVLASAEGRPESSPLPMSLRISQSLRKRVTSRDIFYIDFCSRIVYTGQVTGRFTYGSFYLWHPS